MNGPREKCAALSPAVLDDSGSAVPAVDPLRAITLDARHTVV